MSATVQIPVILPFSFSLISGGELRFPCKFCIALTLPAITFYDAFLAIDYASQDLYNDVRIGIRYASCKRHPE